MRRAVDVELNAHGWPFGFLALRIAKRIGDGARGQDGGDAAAIGRRGVQVVERLDIGKRFLDGRAYRFRVERAAGQLPLGIFKANAGGRWPRRRRWRCVCICCRRRARPARPPTRRRNRCCAHSPHESRCRSWPCQTGKRTAVRQAAVRQAGDHRARCESRAPGYRWFCRRRDSSRWRRASPRSAIFPPPDRHWRASRRWCRARGWRHGRCSGSRAPAAGPRAATSGSRSTTHCRVVAPMATPSRSPRGYRTKRRCG